MLCGSKTLLRGFAEHINDQGAVNQRVIGKIESRNEPRPCSIDFPSPVADLGLQAVPLFVEGRDLGSLGLLFRRTRLEKGARRTIMLPVTVPSHCSLMAPAAEVMADALGAVDIARPSVPVVANVEAQAITTPEAIRAALIAQVTGMVRWRESILWMRDQGVERLVEVGAGKVLSGLARRIDKELDALSLSGPKEIEAFL